MSSLSQAATAAEKRTNARYWIVVMLFIVTSFNYGDRATLSIAGSEMARDIGLDPVGMGYVFSAFSWAYVIGQIPSNLSLHYVRPRVFFPSMMLAWAGLTMVTASVHDPRSIMAIRFFQGIFEASTFVGTHYILGAWYTERELGKRSGIFTASGLAGTL